MLAWDRWMKRRRLTARPAGGRGRRAAVAMAAGSVAPTTSHASHRRRAARSAGRAVGWISPAAAPRRPPVGRRGVASWRQARSTAAVPSYRKKICVGRHRGKVASWFVAAVGVSGAGSWSLAWPPVGAWGLLASKAGAWVVRESAGDRGADSRSEAVEVGPTQGYALLSGDFAPSPSESAASPPRRAPRERKSVGGTLCVQGPKDGDHPRSWRRSCCEQEALRKKEDRHGQIHRDRRSRQKLYGRGGRCQWQRVGEHLVETNSQALIECLRMIPGERHVCIEEGTQSA
jgi:hypothetical protein